MRILTRLLVTLLCAGNNLVVQTPTVVEEAMEQSLSPANWLHVSASGPWQLARVKPSADKRTPQLAPRALLAGEMLAEQRLPDRPSMPSSITCVTTFLQTEGRMAALFTNQRSDTLRPGESLRLFTPRWPGGA